MLLHAAGAVRFARAIDSHPQTGCLGAMKCKLTATLVRLVERKVASGLYANRSEVVREALRLLAERDRLWEAGLAAANRPGKSAAAAAVRPPARNGQARAGVGRRNKKKR